MKKDVHTQILDCPLLAEHFEKHSDILDSFINYTDTGIWAFTYYK